MAWADVIVILFVFAIALVKLFFFVWYNSKKNKQ